MSGSITSWTRLEPESRDTEMRTSLSARLFDPLWLLTRQWQVGEFQAEDAGTPVLARVRATTAPLTRSHLGELPPNTKTRAPRYDPSTTPLEVMVERRRMRAADPTEPRLLALAVEAGLYFLRMLDAQPVTGTYRAAFTARFALEPHSSPVDEAASRSTGVMAGRALDARHLAAALRVGGAASVAQDPALRIAEGDRAEIQQAMLAWLEWYDTLFSEPAAAADDAWIPSRMEYAVSVAARLSAQPEDEVTLSASEFDDGRFDWCSFDRNAEVNMGTDSDRDFTELVETTVPAPVTLRGTPAPRFWEMEDAAIAYGLLPVGPTDLAHLLAIEYATSYGNDWFVIPLTLPVGSLTSINSLVVTDTFGVRMQLRPLGDRTLPAPHWSMWQLAHVRRAGTEPAAAPATNLFFLPPALGYVIDGGAVEDVLFMRDEMANLAWAIERTIEGAMGEASPRAGLPIDDGAAPDPSSPHPRYLLASLVPDNWIPLVPVQLSAGSGQVIQRLKRGAVLQPDGSQKIHRGLGDALNAAADLLLYDEEVPREGVTVTRQRRMSRWIDGSTCVWTAFRKRVGRGEGSSGLVFDQLRERDR